MAASKAPLGVRPPFVAGGEPDLRFREISLQVPESIAELEITWPGEDSPSSPVPELLGASTSRRPSRGSYQKQAKRESSDWKARKSSRGKAERGTGTFHPAGRVNCRSQAITNTSWAASSPAYLHVNEFGCINGSERLCRLANPDRSRCRDFLSGRLSKAPELRARGDDCASTPYSGALR
jgi:hypothetical protein